MIDENTEMRIAEHQKTSRIAEKIEPFLYVNLREMFIEGMKHKAGQIKPNLLTIQANVNNERVSDKDFRIFIGDTIDRLIKRL